MSREAVAVPIADLPTIGRGVVTIGVFDGVHLGHRAILEATHALGVEQGVPGLALVFDPPPNEVLRSGTRVARLAPPAVNLARIEELGVRAVPIRFDAVLRELSAEAFLDALGTSISIAGLTMSSRSAFGRDRGGTAPRMQELGAERGFAVRLVEPVEVDGAVVSSTRIRAAIANGEVEKARDLGVTPYLEGTVVLGDQRGRQLGFPTANLRIDYEPAMPALGIYAGRVTEADGRVTPGHPALISIGTRPTFHDHAAVLAVELLVRLRDEQRFADAEALVAQMRRDDAAGRAVLGIG